MTDLSFLPPATPLRAPQGPQQPPAPPVGLDPATLPSAAPLVDPDLWGTIQRAAAYDPDLASEAKQLGLNLGLAAPVAAGDIERARSLWNRRREQTLLRQSPVIRDAIQNPIDLAEARDGLEGLGYFEKLAREYRVGRLQAEVGFLAHRLAAGEKNLEPELAAKELLLGRLDRPLGVFDIVKGAARFAGLARETVPEVAAGAAVGFGTGAAIGAATGPGALGSGLVGAGRGAAIAMFDVMRRIEGGHTYRKLTEAGVDPETAYQVSAVAGWLKGGLEVIGAGKLAKPVLGPLANQVAGQVGGKLGRGVIKEALRGLAGEVGTEVAQELVDVGAEAGTGVSPGSVGGRLLGAAEGAIAQSALIAGTSAGAGYLAQQRAASRATEAQALLSALGQENPLRERNPEAHRNLVQQIGDATGQGQVFVEAQLLRQLNLPLPEDLAAKVAAAEQEGQDVAIPIGQYDALVAEPAVRTALAPHVKAEPGGMSQKQVEEFGEAKEQLLEEAAATAEKELSERQKFAASAAKVEKQVREQVAERLSPREAKVGAALYRAFVETMATETGQTPEQFHEQVGMRVEAAQEQEAPDVLRSARGAFDPQRLAALLYEEADVSTFVHEAGHYFLTSYGQIASREDAPETVRANMQTLLDWFGVPDLATWNSMSLEQQREHQESFAYNFEKFAETGKAPTDRLRRLFAQFRQFLRRVYQGLTGAIDAAYRKETGKPLPALTPQVRGVMEAMLGGELAARVRPFEPLHQTREQAGMDEAQWAAYQAAIADERAEVAQEMQERSLKAWKGALRNRTNEERKQKRELREAVGEARKKAQAEVEAMPVYQALRFLKRGEIVEGGQVSKLEDHRANREDVMHALGVPVEQRKPRAKAKAMVTRIRELGGISKESWEGTYPGERFGEFRIRGVVRAKGGMTWEQMAQALQSEGYGPQAKAADGVGDADYSWFVDALGDAAGGVPTYRLEDYEALAAAEAETSGAEPEPESVTAARLAAEQAARRELQKFRGMLASPGLPLDDIAQLFGFETGRQMVATIVDAPPQEEMVEFMTRERMAAERGERFDDPRTLRDAVDRATHNDARARLLAMEVQALRKALKQSDRPVPDLLRAAKEVAAERIGGSRLRDLRADQFEVAAARLGREALDAMAAGKLDEALRLRRQQLLQTVLVRATLDAKKAVEKATEKIDRFGQSDKDLAERYEIDVIGAGRAIIAAHKLGPGPTQARPHMEKVREADPELAAALEPVVDRLQAGAKNFRDLTVDDFMLLAEGLEALWDQARRSKLAEIDGKKQEIRMLVDQALAGRPVSERADPPRRTATRGEQRGWRAKSVAAAVRRAESLAVQLDGGRPGSLHRLVIAPLREAFDSYQLEKSQLVKEHRDRFTKLDLPRGQIDAPELQGFVFRNKQQLLGAIAHSGTESNLRKMLLGLNMVEAVSLDEVDTSGWWQFLQRMIDEGVVTRRDLDAVQALRDTYESLKGRTQGAFKDLYGYRFEEIEALPFTARFPDGSTKTYQGGYIPAPPDWAEARRRGVRIPAALQGSTIDTVREIREGLPSTGKGFTITRTGAALPLRLDLNQQVAALDDHLRFLHMQKPGRDVQRILRDPMMRDFLHRESPQAVDEVFWPWIEGTLQNRVVQPGKVLPQMDWLWTALRRNTAVASMFANLTNALQQVTGLQSSLTYVKLEHLRAAAAEFGRAPRDTVREVKEQSDFMTLRLDQQQGQILDDSEPVLGGTLAKASEFTQKHAYFLQRLIQYPVDVITWVGARDQAIAEGKSETEAVREADAAVRLSQGSGTAADISKVERGTPFARLFTLFSGFWLTQLNTILSRPGAGAKARAAASAILFSGLAGSAITMALRGGWDDDDGDGALWDDVALWGLREAGGTATTIGAPVVGPAIYQRLFGEGQNRLSLGAPFQALDRALGAPALMTKDEIKASGVRDLATALTLLTGFPFTTLGRPAGYAMDVQNGKTQPGGAADYLRGLVVGR